MMRSTRPAGHVAAIGHRFPDVDVEQAVLSPHGVTIRTYPGTSVLDAGDEARNIEVVLVGTLMRVGTEVFDRLPRLRGVVRYGIGVDNIDLPAAQLRGIVVCRVPDYATEEVATHALAMLLALARVLPQTDALVRSGRWRSATEVVLPRALAETTLGVVGAGRIGRRLLELAALLPWRRVVFDPWVEAAAVRALGAEPVTALEDLLGAADFISFHAPPDPSGPVLSASRIKMLRPGAILVNCARGELIDSIALAEALRSGALGGAGLDVFEQEPLPDGHPLLTAPNTILTAHTAWLSDRSRPLLRRLATEEALRILRSDPPLNPVPP